MQPATTIAMRHMVIMVAEAADVITELGMFHFVMEAA